MGPSRTAHEERRRGDGAYLRFPLAPAGSSYGVPVVKANPQWYDPALPRAAFQLITLRFRYAGDPDPDRPALAESGDASALRVWEALHKTDWKAASAALTRE